MIAWLARSAVASLGLFVIQVVVGAVLFRAADPPAPAGMGVILLANLLTALLLTRLGERLRLGRRGRAAVLSGVPCAIAFNNLAEAAFFGLGIPAGELQRLFVNGFLNAALFGALLAWLLPAAGGEAPCPRPSPCWWLPRVAFLDVAYPAFYFGAGMLAYPLLLPFYEGRPMPPPGLILGVQLVRALVFVGVAWAIVRHLEGGRRDAALFTGLVLSVIGGVAPLLVPNPYLPDSIRAVHLLEVGVSNLMYGALCGWVLAGPPAGEVTSAALAEGRL